MIRPVCVMDVPESDLRFGVRRRCRRTAGPCPGLSQTDSRCWCALRTIWSSPPTGRRVTVPTGPKLSVPSRVPGCSGVWLSRLLLPGC